MALADSHISPYADRILHTLAIILFSHDDKEFTETVDAVAACLGLAVDGNILLPLLMKNLTAESSKNSVKSLTNVLRLFINLIATTKDESIVDSLPQIVLTIQSLEQFFLDYPDLAVLGAKLYELLVQKGSFALAKHSSVVFGVFLAIQSTLYQREGAFALSSLIEKLARALGYTSSPEMYSAEVKELMERLYIGKEYKDWHKSSKERFKFEVILRHCKEGIPRYFEPIIDIMACCTQPEKDPELKLDMLLLLEFVIDAPGVDSTLKVHANEVIKRVVLQAMVWRTGKPSIKIRKAAVVLFAKILSKSLADPIQLHKLYPDTIACLKNCLDDDWAADLRLVAIQFLRQLVEYLSAQLDQIELSNLYPMLLTRLDDAQDLVRVETTSALRAFLACPRMYLSDSTFEYVCQTLFVHLDDTNETIQLAVFHALQFAATQRKELVLQEARKSLPKQKFPRLCEKLIEQLTN